MTTAFLALNLLLGRGSFRHTVVMFDRILDFVAEGKADAGLIIHEGQLTYSREGVRLVVDLGVWWKGRTGLPLPLGGNVIRRDLGPDLVAQVSRLLRASIAYSLSHREEALDYAMTFGRGLSRKDADTFVGMYVNEWTLDYGEAGRRAVRLFLDEAFEKGLLPHRPLVEFAP